MAHTAKTKKVLGLLDAPEALPAHNPLIQEPTGENIPVVFVKSEIGTQFVNIPFLLINEQLGSIMERFNCCTCDKCIAEVTVGCLPKLPQNIVRIKRAADEELVNKAAADMRNEAIRIITKEVMFIKSNPRH